MSARRRGRTTRLVALVMALGLVLAACGTDDEPDAEPDEPDVEEPDDPADEPDDAEEPEAEPVELDHVGEVAVGSIAIPPIFSMLLPYVAQEAGFFEKYGVDVTLRDMETGVDAARAVEAGDLDVAFSPTGPVMSFAARGVDVTAIKGLDNIDWLVASSNPDVQSCEDLAGETVAVDSIGGARYSILQTILASCELSIDDVEAAAFPGAAAIQAVVAGQLDTSVIHIDDIYVTEEQGEDIQLNVVEWLIDVDPNQHYLVLWALDSTVQAEREKLVRVLAALIEAVRHINDPAARDDVIAIGGATGHSPQVVEQSLDDFLELEFWPLDRHGLTQEKIEAMIQDRIEQGDIEEGTEPSYDEVADASLWEEAFDLVESMN